MVMSVVLSCAGDVAAQYITHRQIEKKAQAAAAAAVTSGSGVSTPDHGAAEFQLDPRRQGAIACYGALWQGPFGHWWYDFLERRTATLPKWMVVPYKVVLDQMVNATASNALYFSAVPLLEGRADAEWMFRKLRLDLWPTLLVDLTFWPGAMWLNFKYVPVKHQLLFVNLCVCGWSCFMSLVCNDDALLRQIDRFHIFSPETIECDMAFLRDAGDRTKRAPVE